jgi:hypothetical protein
MPEKTQDTAAQPGQGKAGLSKMEAVRLAIGKLGKDAKPIRIQQYVKDEYKIEMSADHVSNYKGKILRSRGKKGRKAKKAQAKSAPAPEAAALPSPARGKGAVVITDILSIKDLVRRVGPEQLRTLIDAFAR